MKTRITAYLMALVIAALPVATGRTIATDCSTRSCCCRQAPSADDHHPVAGILAAPRCCCQNAGGLPCTYAPYQLPEQVGWALSPGRTATLWPGPLPAAGVAFLAAGAPASPGTFPGRQHPKLCHPPIYLSVMSFQC